MACENCYSGFSWTEYGFPGDDRCYRVIESEWTEPESTVPFIPVSGDNYSIQLGRLITNYDISGNTNAYFTLTSTTLWVNTGLTTTDGALNRTAVWTDLSCNLGDALPVFLWVGTSICVGDALSAKTYYVGVGANDAFKIMLDGEVIINTLLAEPTGNTTYYEAWRIYQIEVPKGDNHTLEVFGLNVEGTGALGVEIYDNTLSEIYTANTLGDLNIIYTIRDESHVWTFQTLDGRYVGDSGYTCCLGSVVSTCGNNCVQYVICGSEIQPTPSSTPTPTPTPTPSTTPLYLSSFVSGCCDSKIYKLVSDNKYVVGRVLRVPPVNFCYIVAPDLNYDNYGIVYDDAGIVYVDGCSSTECQPCQYAERSGSTCDILTIPEMITECVITNPTYFNLPNGSVGLSISGGTAPYITIWKTPEGEFVTAFTLNNVFQGSYTAYTYDYWKDYEVETVCELIGPKLCDYEVDIRPFPCVSVTPTPTTSPTPTPTITPTITPSAPACNCPPGTIVSPSQDGCDYIITSNPIRTGTIQAGNPSEKFAWGRWGGRIFNEDGYDLQGNVLGTLAAEIYTLDGGGTNNPRSAFWRTRLQNVGVWNSVNFEYVGTLCLCDTIVVPSEKTYYIGIAGDNATSITINGIPILQQPLNNDTNFLYWNIYPVTLNAGYNFIELCGTNSERDGGFGAEIYDNTLSQLTAATNTGALNILFTTADFRLGGPKYQQDFCGNFNCPVGFVYDADSGDCLRIENYPCDEGPCNSGTCETNCCSYFVQGTGSGDLTFTDASGNYVSGSIASSWKINYAYLCALDNSIFVVNGYYSFVSCECTDCNADVVYNINTCSPNANYELDIVANVIGDIYNTTVNSGVPLLCFVSGQTSIPGGYQITVTLDTQSLTDNITIEIYQNGILEDSVTIGANNGTEIIFLVSSGFNYEIKVFD